MRLYYRNGFFCRSITIIVIISTMLITFEGCSKVRIIGANPSTSWNLGVVNVQVPVNGDVPVLVATEGLGLTLAAKSATLGWLRELVILVPDSTKCRIFIVVQTDEELRALKETFAQNNKLFENICVFSKGEEK